MRKKMYVVHQNIIQHHFDFWWNLAILNPAELCCWMQKTRGPELASQGVCATLRATLTCLFQRFPCMGCGREAAQHLGPNPGLAMMSLCHHAQVT